MIDVGRGLGILAALIAMLVCRECQCIEDFGQRISRHGHLRQSFALVSSRNGG
jgi:hypothetical protein